jgi:hypothetical protein
VDITEVPDFNKVSSTYRGRGRRQRRDIANDLDVRIIRPLYSHVLLPVS